MRRLTRCLIVAAGTIAVGLALLAAPSSAASAEMYLGIRNLDCSGVTVGGSGLPASTELSVALLDSAHPREIERRSVATSASGTFTWRADVSLTGLRSVRAVVTRPGLATQVAWTEHVVPSACPLAYTGSGRVLPLVGFSLSSVALGFLLLTAFSYRGRHLAFHRSGQLPVR